MGLGIVAKPRYNFRYDNWGANPATTVGTSVTPGASNSEGSWVQIASSANIAQDVCALVLLIHAGATSANQKDHLLDIGVDPAGGTSYTAVVSNWVCGQSCPVSSNGGKKLVVPLRIKAGSSVAVRVQGSNATAGTVRVCAKFYGQPNDMSLLPCGSFSETIGTISSSGGVSYTPGNAADGAWTSLGTTSRDLWWWQLGSQCSNGTITAQYTYVDLAYGDASNKFIITRMLHCFIGTAEIDCLLPLGSGLWDGFCPVPAGSTIYVRGRCNTAPATGYNAVAIGIGG